MLRIAGATRFGYHRSMADMPDLAAVAALIGDPTRATMLGALMDGRSRTATEGPMGLAGESARSPRSDPCEAAFFERLQLA